MKLSAPDDVDVDPQDDVEREAAHGRSAVAVTPANDGGARVLDAAAETSERLSLEDPVADVGVDVFLLADVDDGRTRALARAWDPSRWTHRVGRQRRALLKAWEAAVAYSIDLLQQHVDPSSEVLWAVGWCFDPGVEAKAVNARDGHVFAVNPVDDAGRKRFRVSDRADRLRLLGLAMHEVAHVRSDRHDELFAGTLTELLSVVDQREADRRIRDAASSR